MLWFIELISIIIDKIIPNFENTILNKNEDLCLSLAAKENEKYVGLKTDQLFKYIT